MKRLLTALTPLVLAPLSAFAISLSEIQDNPQKYVRISEDAHAASYMDVGTIKSIRYNPPYYTLQCRVILISYNSNRIMDFTNTFNYDYSKNLETRYLAYRSSHPSYTPDQRFDLAMADVEKESGVTFNTSNRSIYNFDGKFLYDSPQTSAKKAMFGSNVYICADLVFKKYYGIDFTAGME